MKYAKPLVMKKTKADPTGLSTKRDRSGAAIIKRLKKSESAIKALFRAIPRSRKSVAVIQNAEGVAYEYDLTPEQLEIFNAEIRRILSSDLLETQGDRVPVEWWWKPVIEQPYRQGTLEDLISFNQLVAAAVVAGITVKGFPPQKVAPELALSSFDYIKNLNNVYVSNFATIKTLSDRTADQVIQQINSGIQAGSTPTEISGRISDRFDVSESSARRIADTEINKAYNDAKISAINIASEQTGLRAGVIHISALTNTTRPNHAARHGNAYTTQQQQDWWNSGSERINCLCVTRPALVDASGKLRDPETQEKIKAESIFFSEVA